MQICAGIFSTLLERDGWGKRKGEESERKKGSEICCLKSSLGNFFFPKGILHSYSNPEWTKACQKFHLTLEIMCLHG